MRFLAILCSHQQRYPVMGDQDAYKLIHQATCGNAHAVTDRQAARDGLFNELQNLTEPYPEPAIDPISPDGTLVRVHLSPYIATGGDPEILLHAFLMTSRTFQPDLERLETYLKAAVLLFPGLAHMGETLKDQGYPACHHSEAYRTAYQPAYRVVLEQYL
jgi:hypothetical protein